MRNLLLAVSFLLFGHVTANGKEVVIEQPDGCGSINYRIDPEKITEEAFKTALMVSPRMVIEWSNPEYLELCIEHSPQYSPCGSRDWKAAFFFENGRKNIQVIKEKYSQFISLKLPKELEPIFQYRKAELAYRRWMEEARLAFYSTWNLGELEKRFGRIAPMQECGPDLARLRAAKSKDEMYTLALDWRSCVNNAFRKHFGGYPQEAWKKFLSEYSIEVKENDAQCD